MSHCAQERAVCARKRAPRARIPPGCDRADRDMAHFVLMCLHIKRKWGCVEIFPVLLLSPIEREVRKTPEQLFPDFAPPIL